MKIFNSLTKTIEDFKPMNPPRVTMYTCGPTVYDYMHIGNLRTFVFSDLLKRALEFNGFNVEAVQNITDIDDKIIKRAKERGTTIEKIADEYTEFFLEDVEKLNIDPKALKEQPRATEYVGKMISYIKDLVEKGYAYVEKDGSVYFDISKFENYGKLSNVSQRELKTGTRVLSDEYEKDNVQDFALWKSVEEDEVGFDSPWGKGRPGWHIECSVMSQSILGKTIDIHTGGVDLMFPHHENEIAQSEAETGETFVRYWVHGAHILVDGKKMSKSLGNFYTLKDLEEKGIEPLALRYLYLQTHYRQEMNFTWESLEAAQSALGRLRKEIAGLGDKGKLSEVRLDSFKKAIDDDLNIAQALSLVWEALKSDLPSGEKLATILEMDKVLGLSLDESEKFVKTEKILPDEVKKLLEEREKLRKERKYEEADKIREKIIEMGYRVEDKT